MNLDKYGMDKEKPELNRIMDMCRLLGVPTLDAVLVYTNMHNESHPDAYDLTIEYISGRYHGERTGDGVV